MKTDNVRMSKWCLLGWYVKNRVHNLCICVSVIWLEGHLFYFPHLDRISKANKRQRLYIETTSANAYTGFGNLKWFCIFLSPLSINGANVAAPATLNGLVMLFPLHIKITICIQQPTNLTSQFNKINMKKSKLYENEIHG